MKKFEYKLILQDEYGSTTYCDMNLLACKLKEAGNAGWELCGIDWGYLIFKREVYVPPTPFL